MKLFNSKYCNLTLLSTVFMVLFFNFYPASLKGQNLEFEHFTVEEGLAQSVILSIYQDSEGFLWFGTQSGLSQYNGYEFINYFTNPMDNTTLSNTWIYDITEDNDGDLYLATKGGLNKLDKSTGNFSVINHKSALNPVHDNFIYGICSDADTLYLNTPPALIVMNAETGEFDTYINDFEYDGTLQDLGYPILKAKNGRIWAGSRQGLACFNQETGKFINYTAESEPGSSVSDNHITALLEDDNGDILIGTEEGLDIYHQSTGTLDHLSETDAMLSNNFIRAILRDDEGTIWIATEGGGVNRIFDGDAYDPRNIQYYMSDRNFVSHDIVYSLYIDHSDNLWIGTLAGIDKTDLKKTGIHFISSTDDPRSYNIMDNVIASVYEDKNGRLWIGNWGKGLNILKQEWDPEDILHYRNEFTGMFHIPENHIHVIFEDSNGRIWIGTRDGVSIYEEGSASFEPAYQVFNNPDFDCFSSIRVYCIAEDGSGKIWIGTGNGIYILDIPGNRLITMKSDSPPERRISSNLVYSIIEDSDGDVWIATSEGLNRFVDKTQMILNYNNEPGNPNSLCNDFTVSLFEDKNKDLWIGTGSGLNRYSKKDSIFTYFSRTDGLPSMIIYDIISDSKDNLWFSTGRGLAFINPDKADRENFDVVDQLRGQEFNIRAVYRSPEGELFFGGMKGLVHFYPDSLKKNLFIPPVKITTIEKENDGILYRLNTYRKKLDLSYQDYSVTIEFSALDYTNPSKNRYLYQLKGLSDKWIDIGNRRFVHFTNLSSGSYTFNIKGSNNDGLINENPSSLEINIAPPWWRSNYAYAGYIILLIFIVIIIISVRERTLLREKKILEEKVKIRTTEIQKQKEVAEESELKLRSTINSIDDLVIVLDSKGIIQEFYNPRKRQTHLIFPDLKIGNYFTAINLPDDISSEIEKAYKIFHDSDGIREFDHHFQNDGNIFWYNTKISPKRNPRGKLTGLVIVARDITDRKESEEMLSEQKEELDVLNSTKDKFFSILAHDLKNPFTNLYSMGDLLLKNYDVLEEGEKKEALQKMHKAAEFIYELLENLLTWSRTQRGKIEYNPGVFNLSTLIDININLHKIPSEHKGLKIKNQVKHDLTAWGDREMINTVIRNLVNNAIKFSYTGKSISIRAASNGEYNTVSVSDDGVGISTKDMKKLFRLDEKYKSTGTAGESGTGLGLVLCREFVEKNGGKIWCESEVGKGTIFHFTVPVSLSEEEESKS